MSIEKTKESGLNVFRKLQKAGPKGRLLILSAGGGVPVDTKLFPLGKLVAFTVDYANEGNKFDTITINKEGANKGKDMAVSSFGVKVKGSASIAPFGFKEGLMFLSMAKTPDTVYYAKSRQLPGSATIVVDVFLDAKGTKQFSIDPKFEAETIDAMAEGEEGTVMFTKALTAISKKVKAMQAELATVNAGGDDDEDEEDED